MAGIPTVPDTTGRQVVDSLGLGRSTGTTAQTWAGPVMETGNTSLANSSSVVAPGTANPADTRPGYLAAGQPGGANADTLVPGGQYATDNQVQLIGSPAGTAGGGGQYPNITGTDAVPDPMTAPGWTVQSGTGDEFEQMEITTASAISETHGVAFSVTFAVAGGDGTNTWSLGAGINLPTGVTFTGGSTGTLAGTTSTAQGSANFLVKVVDSHGNAADKVFTLTLS